MFPPIMYQGGLVLWRGSECMGSAALHANGVYIHVCVRVRLAGTPRWALEQSSTVL